MREILFFAGGVLALALILSVSTFSRERNKHDATRDSRAAERAQVSACATTLEAVNAATDDAKAEAARREQAGREAAQAALQAAREAEDRAREASRALAEARKDPDCRQVLEAPLWPAVSLL